MDNLEESINKCDEAWEELQKTLLELFREYFRLSDKVLYEQATTPELESKIRGEG